MSHPDNNGYVTPYEPGRPICIRVFLNEDDTQHSAEMVDVWGNNPPGTATTRIDRMVYEECEGCGRGSSQNKPTYERWRLSYKHHLPIGNGIVAFYRREQDDT